MNGTYSNSICYDAHGKGSIIEDKKEETLDDDYMKGDDQVQEPHQVSDISRSSDINNNLLDSMNQEVEVVTANHM